MWELAAQHTKLVTLHQDLQVLGGVAAGEQGEQLDGAAQREVGELRQHQVSQQWTRPACAPNAGDHVGATPVDRSKRGSKIHLAREGGGLPLTAVVTAANIPDVTMLPAVVDRRDVL